MTKKPGESKAPEGREQLPERWSVQQKGEVVLRLLRGEDLGAVSREILVLARSARPVRDAGSCITCDIVACY